MFTEFTTTGQSPTQRMLRPTPLPRSFLAVHGRQKTRAGRKSGAGASFVLQHTLIQEVFQVRKATVLILVVLAISAMAMAQRTLIYWARTMATAVAALCATLRIAVPSATALPAPIPRTVCTLCGART